MNIEELIKEANRRSEETGEVFFVLSSTSEVIQKDLQQKRDEVIDIIIDEPNYYISNVLEYSRHSIYDTETRETDKYKRLEHIYQSLSEIGFTPKFDIGDNIEKTFTGYGTILTLKPNLMIDVKLFGDVFYNGFFSISKIIKSLDRAQELGYIKVIEWIRDLKINSILKEKI
jgi:hypothetical protein